MDFQQLLAKMQELDRPATESAPVTECPPEMGPMDGAGMNTPSTPPPSMSINLNAQGLDNIEELMALIKAVNPDAEKPVAPIAAPMAAPTMSIEPLKMLPDFDADNDKKIGGEEDGEEDKEDEAFGNSLGASEPSVSDVDAAIPDGNDLNKPKKMFPKAQDGDNPMAIEGTDLRSQIRAELMRRLAEAKGAK